MKLCGTSRYQLLRAGAHTRSESRDGTDGLESRKLSCMEARPLQRDADGGDLAKPRWNQSKLASRGSNGRRSCHDTQANKAPTTNCGRVFPNLFLRPIRGLASVGETQECDRHVAAPPSGGDCGAHPQSLCLEPIARSGLREKTYAYTRQAEEERTQSKPQVKPPTGNADSEAP